MLLYCYFRAHAQRAVDPRSHSRRQSSEAGSSARHACACAGFGTRSGVYSRKGLHSQGSEAGKRVGKKHTYV